MNKRKTQNAKCKVKTQSLKFLVFSFSFAFYALSFTLNAYAKEIVVLYTGDTHAMIYPCNCPLEPDGGVARRITLVKQLRGNNPYTLLLDAGNFFAGGLKDSYTQNSQLDSQRTQINLKAMELMNYDAVAISNDEFNFGSEFLRDNIARIKLVFLSSNIAVSDKGSESYKILPYTLKELAGIKVGIIGVTAMAAAQKAGNLKINEPKIIVKQAVDELKKKNADIIIVLSNQDDNLNLDLIRDTPGIDVLISGSSHSEEKTETKIGSCLYLHSSWQGRQLNKLSLSLSPARKINNYKLEVMRVWDKIKDDPQVKSFLPRCFSEFNCKQDSQTGICQEPGTTNASCVFSKPAKINLTVITARDCTVCDTKNMVSYLKRQFPGLNVSYLYYPAGPAAKIIGGFNLKTLPVYLLGKEAEKEKNFSNLKDNTERKGDFYLLKPAFGGVGYFLGRKRQSGRIDLFISLYNNNPAELLDALKAYKVGLHFLAVPKQNDFEAAGGKMEVEEYLRAVCVEKYYPEYFRDYISCRAKNINSSWWEDCLADYNPDKITGCARGEEGKSLLKENISLNKELGIMFGPTYLWENQDIFNTQKTPSQQEFKKIFKK